MSAGVRGVVWCLLAVAVLVAVGHPLVPGKIVDGHDSYEHALISVATADALRSGELPLPSLPALYGGMGSQCILYHCPAAYYLAGALTLAGMGPYAVLKLLMALAFVIGFLGMTAWLEDRYGPWGGLLGAVALAFSPYYLGDAYWRFAFPEFVALNVLPWVLCATERYVTTGRRSWGLAGAVLIAFLMARHMPTVVMGLPLVALCGALRIDRPRTQVWRLFAVLAAGLTIGSAYWFPAQLELPRMELPLEGTFADFRQHFDVWKQLLANNWDNLASLGSPLQIGWAQLALAIAALGALPWAPRPRRATLGLAAYAAFAIWMTGERSLWFWELVPPLKVLYFPWRFLGPASLALAALAPSAPAALSRKLSPPAIVGVHVCAVLCVAAFGLKLCSARYADWVEPNLVEASKPYPVLFNHYLPRGAVLPPADQAPVLAFVSDGRGQVLDGERTPREIAVRVTMETAGVLTLTAFWYPEWEARVDGHPVPLRRDPISSAMLVVLEPGVHRVIVRYRWSTLRGICLLAALIALAALACPSSRFLRLAWAFIWALALIWGAATQSTLACRQRLALATDATGIGDDAAARALLERGGFCDASTAAEVNARLAALEFGGFHEQVFDGTHWTGAIQVGKRAWLRRRWTAPTWVAYSGTWSVAKRDLHRFRVRSDDGAYLFLDRRCVLDNGHPHGPLQVTQDVDVSAGEHEVLFLYFNIMGTGVLDVSVQQPGQVPVLFGADRVRPAELPWLAEAVAEACRRGP